MSRNVRILTIGNLLMGSTAAMMNALRPGLAAGQGRGRTKQRECGEIFKRPHDWRLGVKQIIERRIATLDRMAESRVGAR